MKAGPARCQGAKEPLMPDDKEPLGPGDKEPLGPDDKEPLTGADVAPGNLLFGPNRDSRIIVQGDLIVV